MKEKLEKKFTLILSFIVIVVLIAVGIPLSVNTVQTHTSDIEAETVISADVLPSTSASETESQETEPELKIYSKTVKLDSKSKTASKKKPEKKVTKSKKNTSSKKSDDKDDKDKKKKKKRIPGFSYATAPTKANVSYSAQWNAGYLVAIDNPDSGYHPSHVELSDKDRDLLERLCYGEFGDGGFTGAALVAQAVRDAMNTYGISSVKQVINQFSYDGRTDHPGGQTIKDAVTYIFDMDKAAVQHRIIYMYDTAYVDSEFHETQNYVCTFKTTRFFDKK